jgi:multiple sugar transport system substrate-binding protein
MKKAIRYAAAFGFTLAGVALTSLSKGQSGVTLNALFMKQAAYSEDDVKSMTAEFEKANPNVKVNLEFVPYESLRDKTIAAQASGGYDVVPTTVS